MGGQGVGGVWGAPVKATLWTEGREQGTVINPGKGDGLVTIRKGQVALVVVVDEGDPSVSRLLRLLDLIASGSAEVVV